MKKILMMLIVCMASLSFGLTTWNGNNGTYQVDTGLDAGTETAGYWFIYGDDADGGASVITWPVEPGNEYSTTALDPIIDYCGGVCGDYTLNKGTLDYNPFVGIGFNAAGEDESGSPAPADASSWNGVCISYSVDTQASLEMGLGDAVDATLGYDNPFASLPKSAAGTTKDFSWTQFKQAGWGSGTITGAEASTKLVSLKFKIQAASGTTGHFNIMEIGEYGKCSGGTPHVISAKIIKNDNIKVSNNTVILNKAEDVSIINLSGETIVKKTASSIDLSSLDQGIYFVKTTNNLVKYIVK